jgi:hypothetical protein
VVHVGHAETLVQVGEGATLRVLRRVDVGAEHLDRAASRKLGITPAEARCLRRRHSMKSTRPDPVRTAVADATRGLLEDVAREVALCVRYHAVAFRSGPPGRIRLLGLESPNSQLRSLLQEATGLTVDSGSVFQGIAGNIPIEDDGGWAAALGLALTFAPSVGAASSDARESALLA